MIKWLMSLVPFLASCTLLKGNSEKTNYSPNPVIAHRGAFKKKSLPQNSIASLQEAIRLKCQGSEFDVRMTAEDTLIVNHDPDYRGMEIEKTTYGNLSAFPLSNGEVLPTLRQYLEAGLAGNRQTRLVLEIKPSASKERGLRIAEKVVELVQEMRAAPYIDYISFDYDILKKILEVAPGASTHYLNGDLPPEQLKKDGISGADYNLAVFRAHPEWIERAHAIGLVLNAWTVNKQEDMEWLLANRFHYVTTDEPELLLELWRSATARKK